MAAMALLESRRPVNVTCAAIVYDGPFSTLDRFRLMKRTWMRRGSPNRGQNKKGHFVRNDPLMPKTGNKNGVP